MPVAVNCNAMSDDQAVVYPYDIHACAHVCNQAMHCSYM